MLCGIFVFNVISEKKINIEKYKVKQIDDNYVYDVKGFFDGKKYIVEGFIFDKNVEIKTSAINLVCKENGGYYRLPTYVIYVDESNIQVQEIANNSWSGFKSIFNDRNVNSDLYILININGNETLIDLNTKLKDILIND